MFKISKPELTMLSGAILFVLSILGPLVWMSMERRIAQRVHDDMVLLLKAGHWFYQEYGIWPSQYVVEEGDYRFGQSIPNSEVINVLRSIEGPGNEHNEVNPNHMVFLELPVYQKGSSGVNEFGEFLDPWGSPYQIVLDTDLNTVCDVSQSIYGMGIPHGMIVWSCGPDGRSDTKDDILSWEETESNR